MRAEILVGIFLAVLGLVFLAVSIVFFRTSSDIKQETNYIETLPLLNVARLQNAPAGTEAVIEARVAERNPLYDNGFVAYVRSQYQGESCSEDDDGNRDCEAIWVEDEWVTPELWLDVAGGGRTRLVNEDYALQNAPVTWRSTETLVEYETRQYRGLKIGNSVFVKGLVTPSSEERAIRADFVYGGDRTSYLTDRRDQAGNGLLGGIIFAAFGLAGIIAGGILLVIGFK